MYKYFSFNHQIEVSRAPNVKSSCLICLCRSLLSTKQLKLSRF